MKWCLTLKTAVGRFGGVKKTQWQNAEPGTVLVNYYTAICGTDGFDRHYELVLKMTESADTVALEEHTGNASEEQCIPYTVPIEAVEKCYEIIDGKRLHTWNRRYKEAPRTGGTTLCRFYDGKKQIGVSTDCMPVDGAQILNEIKSVIQSYRIR